MGGFHSLDPIVMPEKLARLVGTHQVRFVMQDDLSLIDWRMGAGAAGKAVDDWVRANGTRVDPARWWPGVTAASTRGLQLDDLKRKGDLVPVGRD